MDFLGWARWPESPRIGYALLESRTKRWAIESPIGGSFPSPDGECHGCESLPDCDAEPASAPLTTLSCRSGNPNDADAGGQTKSRRRRGGVSLDRQPHRRKSNRGGTLRAGKMVK
jgi:hypothetical protein